MFYVSRKQFYDSFPQLLITLFLYTTFQFVVSDFCYIMEKSVVDGFTPLALCQRTAFRPFDDENDNNNVIFYE